MIMVSVIIVTWNSKDFLIKCLNSISEGCANLAYEIIVVDNASVDNTTNFIRENYSEVKIIENDTNLGFAAACNQAAQISSGKYLFLLNPDTILSRNSVADLIHFIENKSWVGAVGPQLLDNPGQITNSVRWFPAMLQSLVKDTVLGKILFWVKPGRLMHLLPMDKASSVDHVSGGAMLIKKEVWKELNGMDERFFMFYEDVDLCKRIINLGYNIYYLPTVQIIHVGGGSRHQDRSSAFFYSIRSKFLYFEKYYPKFSIIFKSIYKPMFLLDLGFDLILKFPNKTKYNQKKEFFKKYVIKLLFL